MKTHSIKKYTTDWKTIIIVFSVGGILFIVATLLEPRKENWLEIVILIIAFVILNVLLSTKYSYAAITDHTLKLVYILFYRKTIDINSITEINNQPTYKIAKSSFQSVYIFYKTLDYQIKYVELRITVFPEKTIGQLIRDLKEINPNIKLDKYCERLMNKAIT